MSPQAGPLLLQRPIPGITDGHPKGYIRQVVIDGSILDYRYRLYGDINININGDILRDGYDAWDHYETYDKLWQQYMLPRNVYRVIATVTPESLDTICLENQFDLIICTAPRKAMCLRPGMHAFQSISVRVTERAEYPGQPDDTIIFNAGDWYGWVRSSRIFGHEVTEWLPGTDMGDNYPGGRIIQKPISTDCNCHPHVLFTGRFGAWRNETWVDTAYYDTRSALISMARRDSWNGIR